MDELNLENMSPNDVLALDYRIEEMRRSLRERPQFTRPKIQKVANDLRERKDYKSHYLPKVVSMGPIHHGIPELQIGEQYKLIWEQLYIEKNGHDSHHLYKTIADNLAELKNHFADNVLTMARNTDRKSFGSFDEKLAWMLFVDGCSLLYILDIGKNVGDEETIMRLVSRDVLLLENQLPFMLLRLLSDDWLNLMEIVHLFLDFNRVGNMEDQAHYLPDEETTHLLDLLRKMLLPQLTKNKIWGQVMAVKVALLFKKAGRSNNDVRDVAHNLERRSNNVVRDVEHNLERRGISVVRDVTHNVERRSNGIVSYMNIQELQSNGIRIKSSKSSKLDMSFSHRWINGELRLPEIVLDDITVSIFLNLIAYEMCQNFENDYKISTFLTFINSLIRQPEDVKDLRSAGILISNYGSDEELVKLFHFIATDVVSNTNSYSDVSGEINKHMANKWKIKTVQFLRYIRHPWTNFVVHATELAFALGVIQTWFTIHPAKS